MSEPLRLTNKQARRLFIDTHGLSEPRRGACGEEELFSIIQDIGFVQLDTINTVARAHDQILFSRRQNFDRETLTALHNKGRLFEHYTHDASLIPMEFYPYWQQRFKRARSRLDQPGWQQRLGDNPKKTITWVRKHVEREGPTMSRDLKDGLKGSTGDAGGWWGWSPTKTALEYLYRTGELAVAKRQGFQKVYDLSERVIPEDLHKHRPSKAEMVDFKCREALNRIGFGAPTEIGHFWETLRHGDVNKWVKPLLGKELQEVIIEGARGEPEKTAYAFLDLEDRLAAAKEPSKTLRFLSPFDPLIRDRKRLKQLFGFDYTIEIFVPEAKRLYGYYVLPILEGDRIVGRADLKAERKKDVLDMKGLWLTRNVKLTNAREKALHSDLARLAKFCGVGEVDAECPVGTCKT
jgi:hypothetical protein